MCSLNRLLGIALFLLASPSLAAATIYTYKDESGTSTLTNDWDSIPDRHRNLVVPLHAEGTSPTVPSSPTSTVRVISASGEYRMGDHDTRTDAIRLAVESAKRQALEQVATYLESVTEVKHTTITRDDLRTSTAGVVTVLNQQISTRLEGQTVVIRADLTAQVDPNEVAHAIAPSMAAATIYTYKDESGTSTLTNDWDSIPDRYRNRAVPLHSEGISPTAPSPP